MEEIKLPPPERAAKTAIGAGSSGKGTVGSYLKADALFSEKGGTKLDYGSGRGEGAKLIKADTYEPYVKSNPNYDDAKKIPSASYNKVTSLNVLNVLPPEARNEAVKNIGRILTVNGEAIVSTRGVKDVESAKTKVKARDGYIIGKGDDARFQKGFTTQELKNYIQKTLGKGFTVETVKGVGKAAVKIKKLNIPRGFGGVLRQEGTPVINIQEQLLYNPRRKFSQGGDNKMAEDIKDEDIKKAVEAKSDVDVGIADTQLTNLSRQELMNELYRRGRTPEDIMNQTNLTGPEIEALATLGEGKAKGGVAQQMELFSEGGLKDEGGTVDPVSGNDVPPGSTQEEVRDDIPARLSEGEFVFPADVVRYIGLEKLMMMRQEAKAGLKRMEEMGQMGNSDEATLPDDIPFTMDDLDMADDTIEANIGTFVPPKMPTATPYNPNVNPYTPTGVVPTTYAPYKPATGTSLLGASTQGVPETENRRYVNKTTGQVRMIPFNKATGQSLYPIPEGFVAEAETVKEPTKQKTAKVKTTKVQTQADDGGDSDDDVGTLGGARMDVGGREFAVGYNFDGSVTLTDPKTMEKQTYNKDSQIAKDVKAVTAGQIVDLAKMTPAGVTTAVVQAGLEKIGVDLPGGTKVSNIKKAQKEAKKRLSETPSGVGTDPTTGMTLDDMKSIQAGLKSKTGQLDTSDIDVSDIGSGVGATGDLGGPGGIGGIDYSGIDDSNQPSGDDDDPGGVGGGGDAFGGLDFKQGGLAKRKSKTKKMKRGGLASR